jgi:hypothetical protein
VLSHLVNVAYVVMSFTSQGKTAVFSVKRRELQLPRAR